MPPRAATKLTVQLLLLNLCFAVRAEEYATTASGKKVRLKDNGTWEPVASDVTMSSELPKSADEAVALWDHDLSIERNEETAESYVRLCFHFENKTFYTIVGVATAVTISDAFGKTLLQQTHNNQVRIGPRARDSGQGCWAYEDNPFISGEAADRLWRIASNGTGKVDVTITKVIFENGTVLQKRGQVTKRK